MFKYKYIDIYSLYMYLFRYIISYMCHTQKIVYKLLKIILNKWDHVSLSAHATEKWLDPGTCTNILQSATRLVSASAQSILDSPLSVSRSVRDALSRNVNERQNVCRLRR